MQRRLTRDSSTILSSSTHLGGSQTDSHVAPVDLLKCSFVHCPSPDSSMDTLTSRQGHSQYSFGQGISANNDSFHNLTAVTSSGVCSHNKKTSEQVTNTNNVTFSNGKVLNKFSSTELLCDHQHSKNTVPSTSHGHQVLLSARQETDNKTHSLTMARIQSNILAKYDARDKNNYR